MTKPNKHFQINSSRWILCIFPFSCCILYHHLASLSSSFMINLFRCIFGFFAQFSPGVSSLWENEDFFFGFPVRVCVWLFINHINFTSLLPYDLYLLFFFRHLEVNINRVTFFWMETSWISHFLCELVKFELGRVWISRLTHKTVMNELVQNGQLGQNWHTNVEWNSNEKRKRANKSGPRTCGAKGITYTCLCARVEKWKNTIHRA